LDACSKLPYIIKDYVIAILVWFNIFFAFRMRNTSPITNRGHVSYMPLDQSS